MVTVPAADLYWRAISESDYHAGPGEQQFEIDRFQLLHALANLNEICPRDGENLSHDIRGRAPR